MLDRRQKRVLAFVGLFVVLSVLFVDYSANIDVSDPYPSDTELQTNYDAQVGKSIHVWMYVTEVDRTSFAVKDDDLEFTVRGSPTNIEVGDLVQVYGTLEAGHIIDPERIVVSDATNRAYMFVVSGMAAVLTTGLFVREWTVDIETWTLVPRRR